MSQQHAANKKGSTVIGGKCFVWGARTYVMGVINLTPDSFSGDGVGNDLEAARQQALDFQEWDADIIDIGGESTRPASLYQDAQPISVDEELERVVPAIAVLVKDLRIPLSIDTYKAAVAREAVAAGASMINDVWAMRRDPEMAAVAAEAGVPVVLMHNQEGTHYEDLVPDVIGALGDARDRAIDAGVVRDRIIVDPGMGFGKTAEQNLEILRRLKEFETLGQPVLVGMSRKSTIGYVLDLPVNDRLEGTAATVALSIAGGADITRVHDVKEMARVARMSDAVIRGWSQS